MNPWKSPRKNERIKAMTPAVKAEIDAHIDPQPLEKEYYTISEVRKSIAERILRNELFRAIGDLGPQKAAQVVIQVFRLKGLPKELRRHL